MDSHDSPKDDINTGDSPQVVTGYQKRVIGDSVLVRQGAVQSIEANDIKIRQGGVIVAHSGNFELNAGGSAWTSCNQAEFINSSAAVVVSKGSGTLDQSSVQLMAAGGQVTLDQSAAAVLAARDISLKNSAVMFLIAKNVNGDVNPLFGPKEAAVFGAVAGLVGAAVLLVSKLFRGKS